MAVENLVKLAKLRMRRERPDELGMMLNIIDKSLHNGGYHNFVAAKEAMHMYVRGEIGSGDLLGRVRDLSEN